VTGIKSCTDSALDHEVVVEHGKRWARRPAKPARQASTSQADPRADNRDPSVPGKVGSGAAR